MYVIKYYEKIQKNIKVAECEEFLYHKSNLSDQRCKDQDFAYSNI